MASIPQGPSHGARRYPDTLPDSPTLGLELPPVCVGDASAAHPRDHDDYRSDDYNSETRVGDEDEDEEEERDEGKVEEEDEDEEQEDDDDADADWYWQCHLVRHSLPFHYPALPSFVAPLSYSLTPIIPYPHLPFPSPPLRP
jgi:hypothetical protein